MPRLDERGHARVYAEIIGGGGQFRIAAFVFPVVVGGRLYLRYDTHLYCFDVKSPSE